MSPNAYQPLHMRHQLEQIWTIWAPITSTSLLSSALRYCLQRAGNAAVLVGFTTPAQIEMSFTCLGEPLTDADLVFLRPHDDGTPAPSVGGNWGGLSGRGGHMIGGDDSPVQRTLPSAPAPPQRPDTATDELRLMTWNVQHASPARAYRQVAWLANHTDADVLVLTEVRDSAGGQALVQALHEHGYQVIVPDSTDGEYLVVIATRVGALESLPVRLAYLPARFAAVRVTLGPHALGLAGLYVPSRGPQGRRNADKRAFQDAVSAYLPHLATNLGGGPIVIAGDLNVVEPGHQPHYPVFGDWEYRFYTDFAAHGLIDAFRQLHPQLVEHSWFGRSGNGYRFDHIFMTHPHCRLLRSCRYLHQPRRAGLSDHAAMTAALALGH